MTWKDLIATIICFAVAFFIAWLCARSSITKQKDEDYVKEDFEYHEHTKGLKDGYPPYFTEDLKGLSKREMKAMEESEK